MVRTKFSIDICVHMVALFFLMTVSSSAELRNPFEPCLPEKTKDAVSAAAVPVKKEAASMAVLPPPIPVVITPPSLILSGIVWNSWQPQAIINGRVVKVGDVMDDVKIEKISQDGVEGDFKGVKVHLKP